MLPPDGTNWTTAKAVARRLGIDEVEAEVLPDKKSEVVRRPKAAGHSVGGFSVIVRPSV